MLRVWDGNGSASGCGLTGQFTHIYSYNVCEEINNWPDSCGPRRYL